MNLYDNIRRLSQSKNIEDRNVARELCKPISDEEISSNLDAADREKFEYYRRTYQGDKIFKVWPDFYPYYVSRIRK